MKLTLGFSPCPNDTFIFDPLIHHKIDTEGLEFEVFYDDVETLNQKAFRGELDITKLSYHAFAYMVDNYVLLDSGSALGFGVGPMLICKDDPLELESMLKSQDSGVKIGIPGKYTTANFLLGLAFPNATNKQEIVFSEIEGAVLDGRIDIGLIIHENRFTYQDKGLKKIIDLLLFIYISKADAMNRRLVFVIYFKKQLFFLTSIHFDKKSNIFSINQSF